MIFSEHHNIAKLIGSLLIVLFSTSFLNAQRSQQRIAYIDMEYILENIPEYLEAQSTLNTKVTKWKEDLDKLSHYIEQLKLDLANERAILTQDLIEEKKDQITLKQQELRRLESLFFGAQGKMFSLRKQLVKPIQDQVYNSVQDIASRRNYDFVFDKSSDLIILYSNKKHDISSFVLNKIVRDRKIKQKKEQRATNNELTERQRKAKEARKKKEADRLARQKKIEEDRKKKLAEIEAKRVLLRQKKENAKKKIEKKEEQDNN